MVGPAPIKITIAGVDKFSPVLGALGQKINAFSGKISTIGKGLRIGGAGLLGAGLGVAAATGLTAIPGQVLRVEQSLRALGNIGGLTKAQISSVGSELKKVSVNTNQYQEALIEGLNTLLAKGMSTAEALKLIQPIGQAATASQADVNDLANASFTVFSNLKVPITDVAKALDVMAASGQEGSFELADMAREFPALTASAKALGLVGVSGVAKLGAALQVASLGAGGTSEAANNLQNFMKNITSRETVMRFKTEGLDIEAFLKNASDNAKTLGKDFDPIETVVAEMARVTKGNPFLMGRVFNDAQALGFLKSAIEHLDEYRRIRQVSADEDQTNQKNFNNMTTTTIERWKQFRIQLQATDIKPITKGIDLASSALASLNGNSKMASTLITGVMSAIIGGGAIIALGQLALAFKNVGGAILFVSRVLPLVAAAVAANPILALAAALVGIGAIAYMQAKRAADVGGTEGLQRGSSARKLLDQAGNATPLVDKIGAMHKGFEAGNPFGGIASPTPNGPATQEKVMVDVTLKGVPPGSKVETKTTKGMLLNTDIKMGLAYPR